MAPRVLHFPAASYDHDHDHGLLVRFRHLEHLSRSNPALNALLHSASRAVHDEARKITSFNQAENAKLRNVSHSLLQLAEDQDRHPWAPTRVALTLLAQLADLVVLYTSSTTTTTTTTTPTANGTTPHPIANGTLPPPPSSSSSSSSSSCSSSLSSDDFIVVGVGVGLLSGALAAVARDAWEVVQLAPPVVTLGFRCAIELEQRARNIEFEPSDGESAWQMLVTGPPALADLTSQLERINHDVPVHRKAYIGLISLSAATATVCGPPSTLARVEAARDFPWHRTYMPSRPPQPVLMFAPHLPPLNVPALLDTVLPPVCRAHPPLRPLLSSHDGQRYEATCFADLLALALRDIVGRCVHLDSLATSLAPNKAQPLDLIVLGSGPGHMTDLALAVSCISPASTFRRVEAAVPPAAVQQQSLHPTKAVAVVGMAGRFAESDGVEDLWSVLASGVSTAKEIPPSRFSLPNGRRDHSPEEKQMSYSLSGHFIPNPGAFDHRLFAISPVEAMQMDPIQRMALTVTYEALDMAGYPGSDNRLGPDPTRIAVYFGQTTDDWKLINQQRGIDTHYLPGVNRSFTPGRISRYFGWSGGFYSIDTGCSSSATCLCLARDALLAGEIDMAVVGGGNLLTAPEWYEGLGKGGFLSKAGSCSTFSASADGYCRGEAVAVVILKRQDDAWKANDHILATIAGAARNANAHTSVSMTAPSSSAQEALYRRVLRDAATSPAAVGYVEMHGTGTQSGDDAEMAAVANVFGPGHTAQCPLIVGAVKASIGHTEAAAGVVSLIKAILVLQHRTVPPQPGWPFALNPKFPAIVGQEIVIAHGQSWVGDHRSILVNSFDAAGGNVSILVQDPCTSSSSSSSSAETPARHIVVISGHSEAAFMDFKARLHAQITAQPTLELSTLAYSTTARKPPKIYRRSLVVQSMPQLIHDLAKPCNPCKTANNLNPNIVFTFTGQGSQYIGMGMTLYRTSPPFRQLLHSYENICQGYGFGFLEMISQDNLSANTSASTIQVATTALEIALASYLMSLGLVPSLLIGHSLGEYAAYCVAGILSPCDVLWLVHHRARLLEQKCEPRTHGMLSVFLPALTVQKNWGDVCEVSCYNGPNITVVSAPIACIRDLEAQMKDRGVRFTRLDVDFAFHSSQVDPICASFGALAEQVSFQSTKIPLASTVLGRIVEPGEKVVNARYLIRHTRQAVEFVSAVQACEENGFIRDETVVVEIGPRPANIGLIQRSLRAAQPTALATLRGGQNDWYVISSCLAAAHDAGVKIYWDVFHEPYRAHLQHAPLPRPSLDCRNFWQPLGAARSGINHTAAATEKTLLSSSLHRVHSLSEEGSQSVGVFYSTISEKDLANAIQGHVVDGASICPASVFIDVALSAATYLAHESLTTPRSIIGTEMKDLNITSPLILYPDDQHQQIRIEARFDRKKELVSVHIVAANSTHLGSHPKYADCQISFRTGERQSWATEWNKLRRLITDRCRAINSMGLHQHCKLNRALFYHIFGELVIYSDAYQTIQDAAIAVGFLDASATLKFEGASGTFLCNPYMIDSVVHLAGFLLNADPHKRRDLVWISNRIDNFRIVGEILPGREYHMYASVRDKSSNGVAVCDVYVFEDPFELLLSCEGVQFQRVERTYFRKLTKRDSVSVYNHQQETQQHASIGTSGDLDLDVPPDCSSSLSAVPSLDEYSKLLDVLYSVIAAASGLSVQEVESVSTCSFGDMGIDSRISIVITSEFKKRTGIDLPASIFVATSNTSNVQSELKALFPPVQPSLLPQFHDIGRPGKEDHHLVTNPASKHTKPSSDHLGELLHIVSIVLGIERSDLDDCTTWQSLGLDSMQSIQILSAFKDQTGLELPAAYFLQNKSVADVRRRLALEQEMKQPEPKESLRPHVQDQTVAAIVPNRAPSSRAILMQGSAHSKDPPLFLMTDGSGTVEAYIHLPPLPNGRRIYGLESPFVDNPAEFTLTISELAKIFIRAIRSIQPRGPYFIGGWSVGGKYAYEVSRQISLAKDEVALLALLDTRPPRPRLMNVVVNFGTLDDIGMTTARGKNLVDDFTDRERDHLYASCRVQSREQARALTEEQGHPRLCAIVWATKGLNEHPDPGRHRPEVTRKAAMGPVDGEEDEIIKGGSDASRMIYKSWLFGKREDFGANGWQNWFGSRASVVVETVEADHFSMVAPPDVYQLGEVIIKLVTKAAAQSFVS